jgi:hypothetical protein
MPGIDAAILDVTEWLCRKFQVLTGRTNVWLAVQLTNLSIVMYFVLTAMYFPTVPLGAQIAIGLFCSGVLYVLTQTVFKVSIESAENNAYQRVAKGVRNPRRLRDAQLRMSFLTLSVLMLYPTVFAYLILRNRLAFFSYSLIVSSYSLILLTTVLLYVMACDPLPPCTGKVREWLDASAAARQPARESSVVDGSRARPVIHSDRKAG